MVSHWEESDVVAKEMFSNVSEDPETVKLSFTRGLFLGLVGVHVHRASHFIMILSVNTSIHWRAYCRIFRTLPSLPKLSMGTAILRIVHQNKGVI